MAKFGFLALLEEQELRSEGTCTVRAHSLRLCHGKMRWDVRKTFFVGRVIKSA